MTGRRPAPGQPEIGYIEPGHIPAGYLTERPPSPWGSRLVHWAATAAVLAAIICLVGWPWPTLYALGLLAGASILLAGIRLLAAERRKPTGPSRRHALAFNALSRTLSDAGEHVRLSVRDRATTAVLNAIDGERPDASGPAPETTRTIPEASGQQVADQGGDHPDDLRNRIATSLRQHGMVHLGDEVPADEYECCAGAVLAELAPELDALTAARTGDGPWLRAYRDDLIAAQDAIQRIKRQAQDWARLAPPNDVGCTPDDTAYANAGRVLLDILSTPVSTEGA